jgi:hypothetical protein
MSEPRFKSTELTLQEAVWFYRVSALRDTEALFSLLKARALDAEFDPLPMLMSEITPLVEEMCAALKQANTDEEWLEKITAKR